MEDRSDATRSVALEKTRREVIELHHNSSLTYMKVPEGGSRRYMQGLFRMAQIEIDYQHKIYAC